MNIVSNKTQTLFSDADVFYHADSERFQVLAADSFKNGDSYTVNQWVPLSKKLLLEINETMDMEDIAELLASALNTRNLHLIRRPDDMINPNSLYVEASDIDFYVESAETGEPLFKLAMVS